MSTRRFLALGLMISVLLAGVVSRFASGRPDGLERVAQSHGFAGAAGPGLAWAPFAGYPDTWSVVVGCAVVLVVVVTVSRTAAVFTRR